MSTGQSWQKTCGFCKNTYGGQGTVGTDCPNCPKPSDEKFANGLVARGMAPVGYISSAWVENPNVDPETREEAARIRAQQGLQNPAVLGTTMKPTMFPHQQMPPGQNNPMQATGQTVPLQLPNYNATPQHQQYQQPPMQAMPESIDIAIQLKRIADALERLSPPPEDKRKSSAMAMMDSMLSRMDELFGDKKEVKVTNGVQQ